MRPETLFLNTSEHFVLRNFGAKCSGTLTTTQLISKSRQNQANSPLAACRDEGDVPDFGDF